MEIKVLGSGCGKCRSAIGMIERVALASGVEIENPEAIHGHDVHSTPAVVIGDKVVHAGGLPSHDEVVGWLKPDLIGFLSQPSRHLFFTGKGGVGKTSLSTATALTLADAASNRDEMLDMMVATAR